MSVYNNRRTPFGGVFGDITEGNFGSPYMNFNQAPVVTDSSMQVEAAAPEMGGGNVVTPVTPATPVTPVTPDTPATPAAPVSPSGVSDVTQPSYFDTASTELRDRIGSPPLAVALTGSLGITKPTSKLDAIGQALSGIGRNISNAYQAERQYALKKSEKEAEHARLLQIKEAEHARLLQIVALKQKAKENDVNIRVLPGSIVKQYSTATTESRQIADTYAKQLMDKGVPETQAVSLAARFLQVDQTKAATASGKVDPNAELKRQKMEQELEAAKLSYATAKTKAEQVAAKQRMIEVAKEGGHTIENLPVEIQAGLKKEQSDSLAMFNQARTGYNEMRRIEAGGYDPTNFVKTLAGDARRFFNVGNDSLGNVIITGISDAIGDDRDREYAVAVLQYVRAKLRKESGASIGLQEAMDEITAFSNSYLDAKSKSGKNLYIQEGLRGLSYGVGEAAPWVANTLTEMDMAEKQASNKMTDTSQGISEGETAAQEAERKAKEDAAKKPKTAPWKF